MRKKKADILYFDLGYRVLAVGLNISVQGSPKFYKSNSEIELLNCML